MLVFLQDLSHAFLLLRRRNPRFAGLTVLLLGLGIGAATVLFSAFDALLLRPLPVRDPETLVRVVRDRPRLQQTNFGYSVYLALRQHATGLREVPAIHDLNSGFVDGENLDRVRIQIVSASYSAVLGVGAYIGRVLLPEDEQASLGTLPAVLSFDFWRRRYQEDRGVLGRKVLIQGHPFIIVGVLPRGFNGALIDVSPDVRVSMSAVPIVYAHHDKRIEADALFYEIVGRLKSGVPLQQARDEAFRLFRSAMEEELAKQGDSASLARQEDSFAGFRLEPIPRGISRLRDQFSNAVVFLMIAVGVLLLMVCANVSGLLMARFAAREREFGIRLSVGASPGRLFGLAAAEALLLASAGGLSAIALTRVYDAAASERAAAGATAGHNGGAGSPADRA